MTGSLRGAFKGALIGAVTAGIFEGIAQYVFDTSTVGPIAENMRLRNLGVSEKTIAQLYGDKSQFSADGSHVGEISDESVLGTKPQSTIAEFNKVNDKFKTTSQYRAGHSIEFKDAYGIGYRNDAGSLVSFEEFKTFGDANKFAALKVNGFDKVWLNRINIKQGNYNYSYLFRPSTYSYGSLSHYQNVLRTLSH